MPFHSLCNKEVVFSTEIIDFITTGIYQGQSFKEIATKISKEFPSSVSEVLNENTLNHVIQRILLVQEFLSALKKRSCNKTINVILFFMSQESLQMFVEQEK